jgi:hypothetical protein
VILQVKAGNLNLDDYQREVWAEKRPRKGRATQLNQAVTEVLTKRGSYIICTKYPMTARQIATRRQKVLDGITEGGGDPTLATNIDSCSRRAARFGKAAPIRSRRLCFVPLRFTPPSRRAHLQNRLKTVQGQPRQFDESTRLLYTRQRNRQHETFLAQV